MYFLKKKLWCLLLLLVYPFVTAGFEGKIMMVKKTYYDTSYIQFFVKGNQVRIDNYTSNEELGNTLIINTKSEKAYLLDFERMKYTELHIPPASSEKTDNYKILKTKNFKKINGIKCYQWRVRNREKNSEVAFWVARKDLDFFNKLIPFLSQIDETYFFYEKIQGKSNFFPFMIVERILLRKEKKRLAVIDIQRTSVGDYQFKIPSNYQEVKRKISN